MSAFDHDDTAAQSPQACCQKLFSITTLDVVYGKTFTQGIIGSKDPSQALIPVVGSHAGETIVPLFNQAKPTVKTPDDKLDALTNRVYLGGDEVVKAKDDAGSASFRTNDSNAKGLLADPTTPPVFLFQRIDLRTDSLELQHVPPLAGPVSDHIHPSNELVPF